MSEYIIYADESDKRGTRYSNFYGGTLIHSSNLIHATQALNHKKSELNLFGEIKWNKVTSNYLAKYIEVMNVFFHLVKTNKLKVRVMFTDNTYIPQSLTTDHYENEYFILYYQFIKHAFGLAFAARPTTTRTRLYLDRLPDTKEKTAQFKSYLAGLTKSPEFRRARILVDSNQIAEIDSHDHVILQCTDIVLGSMAFRLNDKHKIKPEGSRVRGKTTRAKEALYKHINTLIRDIYPNFNVGITTGYQGDPSNRWRQPYRHWVFKPQNHTRDLSRSKKK